MKPNGFFDGIIYVSTKLKGENRMNGKSKCKILKDIRKQIAKENDIEFITSECKYQGDCLGTCPKCEAEVRYLEEELKKRKNAGKKIAVAGIAAAFTLAASSCNELIDNVLNYGTTAGDPLPPEQSYETVDGQMPSEYSYTETAGDPLPSEESEVSEEVAEMGELPPEEVSEEVTMGDVADPNYNE